MRSKAISLVCAAMVLLASCKRSPEATARDALTDSDNFELLSLDPIRLREPSPDQYYEWCLLGATTISDPATRSKLTDALCDAIRASDGSVMACFDPRHAIRVRKGGRVTEFVICFECQSVSVYTNGARTASYPIAAKNERVFDAALNAANVPLAAKSKDAQK